MTQSIKVIFDAILAAAKRDELIVIESGPDNPNPAMLCSVSMHSLEITPLAVIYGDESELSALAPFTADDAKFLLAMGISCTALSIQLP
jgi:hypothetical protein